MDVLEANNEVFVRHTKNLKVFILADRDNELIG